MLHSSQKEVSKEWCQIEHNILHHKASIHYSHRKNFMNSLWKITHQFHSQKYFSFFKNIEKKLYSIDNIKTTVAMETCTLLDVWSLFKQQICTEHLYRNKHIPCFLTLRTMLFQPNFYYLRDNHYRLFVWLEGHVLLANAIKHPPQRLTSTKVELKHEAKISDISSHLFQVSLLVSVYN